MKSKFGPQRREQAGRIQEALRAVALFMSISLGFGCSGKDELGPTAQNSAPTSSDAGQKWQQISVADGRMKIQLPADPLIGGRLASKTFPNVYASLLTIDADRGMWFKVKYNDVSGASDAEKDKLPAKARDAEMSFADGTVISETARDLYGYPGLEVVIDTAPFEDAKTRRRIDPGRIVMRTFVADGFHYALVVEARDATVDNPEVKKFFDSVTLRSPGGVDAN
jgi:hypothetical protein